MATVKKAFKKKCWECKTSPGRKIKSAIRVMKNSSVILRRENGRPVTKVVIRCNECESNLVLANVLGVTLKELPAKLKSFHKGSEKFGQHWEPPAEKKKVAFASYKPAKVIRGTCKRCKREDRKLTDWLWRDHGGQRNLWCRKCCFAKFMISLDKGLIAAAEENKRLQALAAQEHELGIKNGKHRRALGRSTFQRIKRMRSLAAEGNMPLMRRLLSEGKKFKELIKIYTELYTARGQSNPAWIRDRVRTYRRCVRRENKS